MPEIDSELHDYVVGLRRKIHKHPETALEEIQTTETIAKALKEAGVETDTIPNLTGAVGLLKGAGDGPTIGLRADIDALPVREMNSVPYKSRIDGVMHACGHDANTAVMLGVARKIVETGFQKRMKGNVKFLFQPAEERLMGAEKMIGKGVLENPVVDRVIAGHMAPDLPVGKVGIFRNIAYASSDSFRLVIHGKGGHGARPEECVDPIHAGAFFITQIQSIVSRNISNCYFGIVDIKATVLA